MLYGSLIFNRKPKQYANFWKTDIEGELDEWLVQNTDLWAEADPHTFL